MMLTSLDLFFSFLSTRLEKRYPTGTLWILNRVSEQSRSATSSVLNS